MNYCSQNIGTVEHYVTKFEIYEMFNHNNKSTLHDIYTTSKFIRNWKPIEACNQQKNTNTIYII